MAASKLQEAIALIRSGDRQNGQKLLTEVLNTDPKNETAWLWMSALVAGERRRFCLEKVLSINPNHPQAREQLAKLAPAPSPAAPVGSSVSQAGAATGNVPPGPLSIPEAARAVSPAPVQLPNVWLTPKKYFSDVIYLEGNTLLTFNVPSEKAAEALAELGPGVTPQQFDELKNKFGFKDINHMALPRVGSMTLFGDGLKIVGLDKAGQEKKFRVSVNEQNAETILRAVEDRLGPGFQRTTRPISRLQVTLSALALLVMTICGTGFFWWFVRGLQAEVEADGRIGGSARARGIAALLLLIGPNGFLCIGALVLIVVLFAMISSLARPPEETVLTRAAGS